MAQLTVLPSLTPATAFLAFQKRLASLLAIALHSLFARFIGSGLGGFLGIEGDGERCTRAACGGGDVEGLEG